MTITDTQQQQLSIRDFKPADAAAFRAINEAWITRYFVLESHDLKTLNDPQAGILDKGGRIFMAFLDEQPVGCCALIPIRPGEYEVSKMGVLAVAQGQGVGRRVLQAAIDWAKADGAHRLYLETNHQLRPAIHLYHAVGFQDVPADEVTPSPYARADVSMQMWLRERA